jgi:hypothetical protein
MTAGPFILEIDEGDEGPTIHALTPASVLVIHGADELNGKLEAFRDPVKNKVVQNTTKARRWYVEKILPALRYYCDKYDVPQPDWLVGNNHWEGMDDEEKELLFGPGELKFREFQPVNVPDIHVDREEEEVQQ